MILLESLQYICNKNLTNKVRLIFHAILREVTLKSPLFIFIQHEDMSMYAFLLFHITFCQYDQIHQHHAQSP